MVTEDYVNFKISKLLKEKGFPQELGEKGCINTIPYYIQNGQLVTCDINTIRQRYCPEAAAPTLQMAMKWLREVHNIYIDILAYTTGKNTQFRWVGYEKGRLFSQEEGKTIYFETYEQACEAAIKYCLENSI